MNGTQPDDCPERSHARTWAAFPRQQHTHRTLSAIVPAALDIVRTKYKEYGFAEMPYITVKANAEPSGIAIMTVAT